jgi:hypothetical protein
MFWIFFSDWRHPRNPRNQIDQHMFPPRVNICGHVQGITMLCQFKSTHGNITCAHESNICRLFSTYVDALQHRSTFLILSALFKLYQRIRRLPNCLYINWCISAHVNISLDFVPQIKLCQHIQHMPILISRPQKMCQNFLTCRHNDLRGQECPTFGDQLKLC